MVSISISTWYMAVEVDSQVTAWFVCPWTDPKSLGFWALAVTVLHAYTLALFPLYAGTVKRVTHIHMRASSSRLQTLLRRGGAPRGPQQSLSNIFFHTYEILWSNEAITAYTVKSETKKANNSGSSLISKWYFVYLCPYHYIFVSMSCHLDPLV